MVALQLVIRFQVPKDRPDRWAALKPAPFPPAHALSLPVCQLYRCSLDYSTSPKPFVAIRFLRLPTGYLRCLLYRGLQCMPIVGIPMDCINPQTPIPLWRCHHAHLTPEFVTLVRFALREALHFRCMHTINELPASNYRRIIGGSNALFIGLALTPVLPSSWLVLPATLFTALILSGFFRDWRAITRGSVIPSIPPNKTNWNCLYVCKLDFDMQLLNICR
jgi:hypothetical protein